MVNSCKNKRKTVYLQRENFKFVIIMFLKRLFYKWLMNAKSQGIDFGCDRMIEKIEEYHLIDSSENGKQEYTFNKVRLIFKSQTGEKISYNIFYYNLHIRIELSPREKVYSMHLKKHEDVWCFNKDSEGNYDFSHPKTPTFRIFIAYDVPVLNITRAKGESYSHGTWDEYVYRTLFDLEKEIYFCTDEAQFNKCYDCRENQVND